MKINDNTGISALVIALLATQAVVSLPISNSMIQENKGRNIGRGFNVETATGSYNNTNPSVGNFTKEDLATIIRDITTNNPIVPRNENITTQEKFNRKANELIKKAIKNNSISSPDIPYNNVVDITPCLDLLRSTFSGVNFSMNEACDYAYKENFPDYKNRETIAKDKNTNRLVKIIVPSVLAPTMLGVLISLCCCCGIGGFAGIKRLTR